jgi:hypothetical protein
VSFNRKDRVMNSKLAPVGILTFALLASSISVTSARTIYDGRWTLSIVTERGACDRYNFPVDITNGNVTFPGLVNARGRVTPKGTVRVFVSAMGKTASGSGRLSRSYGSGRWAGRSGDDRCSGTWTVQRS